VKLHFENYTEEMMEMGHFGPKIEAQKDETLSQHLQNVARTRQTSLLDLRHPNI
jgi:hypothetical protein